MRKKKPKQVLDLYGVYEDDSGRRWKYLGRATKASLLLQAEFHQEVRLVSPDSALVRGLRPTEEKRVKA